jgi:hypothetical protein
LEGAELQMGCLIESLGQVCSCQPDHQCGCIS